VTLSIAPDDVTNSFGLIFKILSNKHILSF